MPRHRRHRPSPPAAVAAAAGLACLAACAPLPPNPEVAAPAAASPEAALDGAIDETRQAMAKLYRDPRAAASVPQRAVPDELQRPEDISARGDLDAVARALAERLRYGFSSDKAPATPPLAVTLDARGVPIVQLFQDLGAQAGDRADIVLDPDRRTVEVKYHA